MPLGTMTFKKIHANNAIAILTRDGIFFHNHAHILLSAKFYVKYEYRMTQLSAIEMGRDTLL